MQQEDAEVKREAQPDHDTRDVRQEPTGVLHHLQNGGSFRLVEALLVERLAVVAKRLVHRDVRREEIVAVLILNAHVARVVLCLLRAGVAVESELIEVDAIGLVVTREAERRVVFLAADFKFIPATGEVDVQRAEVGANHLLGALLVELQVHRGVVDLAFVQSGHLCLRRRDPHLAKPRVGAVVRTHLRLLQSRVHHELPDNLDIHRHIGVCDPAVRFLQPTFGDRHNGVGLGIGLIDERELDVPRVFGEVGRLPLFDRHPLFDSVLAGDELPDEQQEDPPWMRKMPIRFPHGVLEG